MGKKRQRIQVDGEDPGLANHPSLGAALDKLKDLPSGPTPAAAAKKSVSASSGSPKGTGERIEVRRVKAGRGGKVVTEVSGFAPTFSQADRDQWLLRLKQRLGCGGTRTTQGFELQGDRVEILLEIFKAEGFRPVRTGG